MEKNMLLFELNNGVLKIEKKENNSILKIKTDGSWEFTAPHLPEISSLEEGNDILVLIEGALLNRPKK